MTCGYGQSLAIWYHAQIALVAGMCATGPNASAGCDMCLQLCLSCTFFTADCVAVYAALLHLCGIQQSKGGTACSIPCWVMASQPCMPHRLVTHSVVSTVTAHSTHASADSYCVSLPLLPLLPLLPPCCIGLLPAADAARASQGEPGAGAVCRHPLPAAQEAGCSKPGQAPLAEGAGAWCTTYIAGSETSGSADGQAARLWPSVAPETVGIQTSMVANCQSWYMYL